MRAASDTRPFRPEAPPALSPRWPAATLPAAIAGAAFAGVLVAIAGGVAGPRAIYYSAIVGLIAVGAFAAATRREPARFAFLSLFCALPFADVPVPPGRLGIRVFDLVMLCLAAVLLARRFGRRGRDQPPLFPSRSLSVAWLLFLVCVICSLYPLVSMQMVVVAIAIYAFFLWTLDELGRERGFERLVLLLSLVILVLSTGLFADFFLHQNLSLRGGNLNQLSWSMGREIWRAGGFFQDPQKAGAFLASVIAFLIVLAARGRFAGSRLRYLVWAAIAAGLVAIFTTIARGAIIACLVVSAIALLGFNRWGGVAKLLIACALVVLGLLFAILPSGTLLEFVPQAVANRFARLGAEFQIRLQIWFDTWDMFAQHPVTGIGPGAFQSYLIDTRPGMAGYYGIGVEEGVSYVPEQPESGYLKVLYESGILGSLAALLLIGDALRRAFRVLARGPEAAEARTETIAVLAALAAFAVTFATLYTAGDSRIAALLMFLFAVLWHHVPRPQKP